MICTCGHIFVVLPYSSTDNIYLYEEYLPVHHFQATILGLSACRRVGGFNDEGLKVKQRDVSQEPKSEGILLHVFHNTHTPPFPRT